MTGLAQQPVPASFALVEPVLFYLLAVALVGSAWAIVLTRNIVRAAVYLLLTLAGVAGLYLMLQAEFLAAIQLIIYAGGTLILIVFGIMLTNKLPASPFQAAPWERLVATALGLTLASLLVVALALTRLPEAAAALPLPDRPAAPGQVEWLGRGLLSDYLVPFEVAAMLLLAVMVGAAFIARKRREEPE